MRNGMYLINFVGTDHNGQPYEGVATLTFQDGMVYGFDSGGAQYDGICVPGGLFGLAVDLSLTVKMPPNVVSVIGGLSYPHEWSTKIKAQMSLSDETGSVLVHTEGPPVRATFTRMRDLPSNIAA